MLLLFAQYNGQSQDQSAHVQFVLQQYFYFQSEIPLH